MLVQSLSWFTQHIIDAFGLKWLEMREHHVQKKERPSEEIANKCMLEGGCGQDLLMEPDHLTKYEVFGPCPKIAPSAALQTPEILSKIGRTVPLLCNIE